jgi:hypothetical protein
MKKLFISLIVLSLIPGMVAAEETQVDFGISIADGELRSFYLAVGSHYSVPPKQVVSVKERYRFRSEELPVVYFLAARARVKPSAVIDLRMNRMSWFDISIRFGLSPEIFFVPLDVEKVGPPYGNAYGYYKKYRPQKEWRKIILSDSEVVDLVNLRFISEYQHIPPGQVIEMRGKGRSFVNINEQAKAKKAKGNPKGKKGKVKKKKPS